MGIHRNVIHPRFGSFVLLGTILVNARVNKENFPIDYNPCLECKLCVAACPVGAISPEGEFNFSSCYTHNYREFMSGFSDWVETVVESKNTAEYRANVPLTETVSWWQSLSFGANYKAAYCIAACPAGEDVIGAFLNDRKTFVQDVVRPLQDKVETVYVIPGSDAEAHVAKRFPHKTIKRVSSGIRLMTIASFINELPRAFQRKQAAGLNATFHFNFTGAESRQVTITIRSGRLEVQEGITGKADIRISADSRSWLAMLAKEKSIVSILLRGKIRIKGSPKLLLSFGKCFPM
jgi:NAD-dependent dihydropyrimidine dehydrogenase PreA subunit/putative sterol carrier protein